jgi:hypothetical protein
MKWRETTLQSTAKQCFFIGRGQGERQRRSEAADAGGAIVIRQAISCDICGNEKKHTNHWFVVYEQGGELRVSGWSSRNRFRPGTKHLCGQICLHKLVDDFMARAIDQKGAAPAEVETSAARTDASLTSRAAYDDVEFESSARLITPSPATLPIPAHKPAAELVAMAGKQGSDTVIPLPNEPRYASRNWRAEAWEREREREIRGQDCRTDLARRRASVQ